MAEPNENQQETIVVMNEPPQPASVADVVTSTVDMAAHTLIMMDGIDSQYSYTVSSDTKDQVTKENVDHDYFTSHGDQAGVGSSTFMGDDNLSHEIVFSIQQVQNPPASEAGVVTSGAGVGTPGAGVGTPAQSITTPQIARIEMPAAGNATGATTMKAEYSAYPTQVDTPLKSAINEDIGVKVDAGQTSIAKDNVHPEPSGDQPAAVFVGGNVTQASSVIVETTDLMTPVSHEEKEVCISLALLSNVNNETDNTQNVAKDEPQQSTVDSNIPHSTSEQVTSSEAMAETGQSALKCTVCEEQFADTATLEVHSAVHKVKKKFKCKFCEKEFGKKKLVHKHMRKIHQESLHGCGQCSDLFVTETELSAHVEKSHHLCKLCFKQFKSLSALAKHRINHNKQFECHECGKKFPYSYKLNLHMQRHLGNRPFPCTMCDKAFVQNSELQAHLKSHSDERPFECIQPNCDKKYRKLADFNLHMRTHSSIKPFRCSVCDKGFIRASKRDLHMKTHTGEKTIPCPVCNQMFIDKGSLISHKRTHTGEKPYKCRYCSDCFAQAGGRTIHERRHTGERPFACDLCDKRFTMSSNLVQHKRTHTGVKLYKCGACAKIYAHSNSLRKHMRKVHGSLQPVERVHEVVKKQSDVACPPSRASFSSEDDYMPQDVHEEIVLMESDTYVGEVPMISGPATTVHDANYTGGVPMKTEEIAYVANNAPEQVMGDGSTLTQIDGDVSINIFQCSICDSKFSDLAECVRHFTSHTAEPQPQMQQNIAYVGEQVMPANQPVEAYIEHQDASGNNDQKLIFHNYEPVLTEIGQSTHSNTMLTVTHTDQKVVTSEILPYFTKSKKRRETLEDLIRAQVINDKETHLDAAAEEYPCYKCGDRFMFYDDRNEHLKSHLKRLFKCPHCERDFTRASNLKTHMRTHSGDKPYECPVCSKSFFRSDVLAQHMATHTGEKKYYCSICDKYFSRQSSLTIHKFIHDGIKRFQCSVCSKLFTQSGDLNRHIKSHLNDKPHRCELCSKGFIQASDLQRHMMIHSGNRPYVCSICNKGFTRANHVSRHMASHSAGTIKTKIKTAPAESDTPVDIKPPIDNNSTPVVKKPVENPEAITEKTANNEGSSLVVEKSVDIELSNVSEIPVTTAAPSVVS